MLHKILYLSGWIIGLSALAILLGASISRSNEAILDEIQVAVEYGEDNRFIEQKEIAEVVTDFGYAPSSTPLAEINPSRIEKMLENRPFVKNAEVYKELNGRLHVDVEVRQPVMRVYNQYGQSVYVDELGAVMPTSSAYAARAPIVNGWLDVELSSLVGRNILSEDISVSDISVLREVFAVVMHCRSSELWKAQFVQFYVNAGKEIELIPRVGDHVVLIGSSAHLEKKLNKLRLFYSHALDKTGWNEYRTINLKYANQVVCTKS